MSLEYTVGATWEVGFYVQIPWHLRGTAVELMTAFEHQHEQGVGDTLNPLCLGFEFRDNGVQIQRHRFPWATDG